MKKIFLLTSLILSLGSSPAQQAVQDRQDEGPLKGPYLGQRPPGLVPEPFAPGRVTTAQYEYGGVFAPGLDEFYYIAGGGPLKEPTLVVFRNNGDHWVRTDLSTRMGQPTFSSDGKRMYLGRRYMERTRTGWSQPKELGGPFKDARIMRLSVSNKGNCYFDTYHKDDPTFPIRCVRRVNGSYEAPRVLDAAINTGEQLNHPFIAPDESYLIWDAKREEGYGDSDLYISYRQPDGTWGKAVNLGEAINTSAWEAAASITPDGKYLFFSRNIGSQAYENVDIYWVDARILEKLKPE